MVLTMTVTQAKESAARLKKIAKEIRDTAIGSSRLLMYQSLASEVEAEAITIEACIR